MESKDTMTQAGSPMTSALREAVKNYRNGELQFTSEWSVTAAGYVPQRALTPVVT